MNRDDESLIKRFMDLSSRADKRNIVLFTNFLNLNEINLLQQCKRDLPTKVSLYGGYDNAERQMVAFQPDALYYNWEYPISCVKYQPVNRRFADELTHRDVLGALMNLGIDRSLIGDIVFQEDTILIFCTEQIAEFLLQELYKIKHTQVVGSRCIPTEVVVRQEYEEMQINIPSNRLDAFVAGACKFSRSKAAEYILGENVFIDGKLTTNHNASLAEGNLVSLRKVGKLRITNFGNVTKKGRIWVTFEWFK